MIKTSIEVVMQVLLLCNIQGVQVYVNTTEECRSKQANLDYSQVQVDFQYRGNIKYEDVVY